MPLEIHIDVIPHGDEDDREQLGSVRITQIRQLDNSPGGLRDYEVIGKHRSIVRHRRSNGALALCALALMADAGLAGED